MFIKRINSKLYSRDYGALLSPWAGANLERTGTNINDGVLSHIDGLALAGVTGQLDGLVPDVGLDPGHGEAPLDTRLAGKTGHDGTSLLGGPGGLSRRKLHGLRSGEGIYRQ